MTSSRVTITLLPLIPALSHDYRRAIAIGSFIILLCLLAFSPPAIADEPPVAIPIQQPQPTPEKLEINRKIRMEMCFLRRAVKLTPEQDERLSAFDATKLQDARVRQRKVAPGIDFGQIVVQADNGLGVDQVQIQVNNGLAVGQVQIQVNNGLAVGQLQMAVNRPATDPLRLRQIERAFEKEVDLVLTDEQKTVYANEKKLRDEFNTETAVRGLLIILDKRLSLSQEQISSLRPILMEWSGVTAIDIAPYATASNYLPLIPDSILTDHLNEHQKAILRSIPRIEFGNQIQFRQQFIGDIEIGR